MIFYTFAKNLIENIMADSTRHIASTVGTIPAGTAITGTVTVSPDRDDVLIYTGSDD